jgi:hypothetical protein
MTDCSHRGLYLDLLSISPGHSEEVCNVTDCTTKFSRLSCARPLLGEGHRAGWLAVLMLSRIPLTSPAHPHTTAARKECRSSRRCLCRSA